MSPPNLSTALEDGHTAKMHLIKVEERLNIIEGHICELRDNVEDIPESAIKMRR